MYRLGEMLKSIQRKYPRDERHTTSTIEVLLIQSRSRTSIEPLDFHEVYYPGDGAQG
jgi:hypothetical protein